MNPIIDTNMLKHHRVDYGPSADLDTSDSTPKPRSDKLAVIAWVPVFLMIVAVGSWAA